MSHLISRPALKRVAIFQIRVARTLGLCFSHVVGAKPLHTFARHALEHDAEKCERFSGGIMLRTLQRKAATGKAGVGLSREVRWYNRWKSPASP
ncbi:hypothetical protein CO667_08915 [Rhizobium sp. L43]|nr:hypothetical protein CO667_08915 [Rhizobium sp. L43]